MPLIYATETKASEDEITYSVNTIDGEKPAAWMRLSCIRRMTAGNQDSGRQRWTVILDADDAEEFEEAMDEDDDVVDYTVL